MSRWLLLLGSNLPDDFHVRAALDALAALGPCRTLGPIRRLPSSAGDGVWYHNVVATLEHPGGRALRDALRAIQVGLGRDDSVPGRVDIDIDLVARAGAGGAWIMDAHAASKSEMHAGPVRRLFDDIGVVMRPPVEEA